MEWLQAHVGSLLWVPVALGLVWMAGPLVLFWSRLRVLRTEATEDAGGAARPTGDRDLDRFALECQARGFQPVGWIQDHCRFFTPVHWKLTCPRELVLASPDRTRYVVAYRLGSLPIKMNAHTALEGGGLLSTSTVRNRGVGPLGDRYQRLEIENIPPSELIDQHERHVQHFCRERGLRARGASLSELVAEIWIMSQPYIARPRLMSTYALPAVALISVVRPAEAGHADLSETFALACLGSLITFAILRVLALPEFKRVWKVLALVLVALPLLAPHHWAVSALFRP